MIRCRPGPVLFAVYPQIRVSLLAMEVHHHHPPVRCDAQPQQVLGFCAYRRTRHVEVGDLPAHGAVQLQKGGHVVGEIQVYRQGLAIDHDAIVPGLQFLGVLAQGDADVVIGVDVPGTVDHCHRVVDLQGHHFAFGVEQPQPPGTAEEATGEKQEGHGTSLRSRGLHPLTSLPRTACPGAYWSR